MVRTYCWQVVGVQPMCLGGYPSTLKMIKNKCKKIKRCSDYTKMKAKIREERSHCCCNFCFLFGLACSLPPLLFHVQTPKLKNKFPWISDLCRLTPSLFCALSLSHSYTVVFLIMYTVQCTSKLFFLQKNTHEKEIETVPTRTALDIQRNSRRIEQ